MSFFSLSGGLSSTEKVLLELGRNAGDRGVGAGDLILDYSRCFLVFCPHPPKGFMLQIPESLYLKGLLCHPSLSLLFTQLQDNLEMTESSTQETNFNTTSLLASRVRIL